MILFTKLNKPIKNQKTYHYIGDISSDNPQQKIMSLPNVLIIEEHPDGIYLDRYTFNGLMVGDTWHQSIKDAKHQAAFEYEDSLGEWLEVPENVEDPIKYVLEQINTNE